MTDPAIASHFAPDGPVATCFTFLESVLGPEPDYLKAWGLMDRNLRLCRAQAWLWNNRDYSPIGDSLQELAEWMAGGSDDQNPPTPLASRLWVEFEKIELQMIEDSWRASYNRVLGAASHARPIGIDLELVVMLPTDGDVVLFEKPTLVDEALLYVMRFEADAWRVAAWGDRLPEPGWPPNLNPDPDPAYGA